ncbi:MAG: GntR family transcriptional regulator [Thermomicrobiales bacterium]
MSFSAVTVIRPYEQIARQIQDAIRDQTLKTGDKLPTERELAETFGVSRSVVREAIKVLSAHGLVEARQGSGLFVLNRPVESVSRAIVLSVSPDADSVDKLFEFRQLLETEAARLAALRATVHHTNQLDAIISEFGQISDVRNTWENFAYVDDTFHAILSDASQNPYLAVMVASVRALTQDVTALIANHPGSIDEAMRHHCVIRDAVMARDAVAAARAMADHIAYTAHVVQEQASIQRTGETSGD